MRNAAIVSTARTPIGKAYRGAFNDTQAQALAAHALSNAIERAGVDGTEIEDVILGCAMQEGATSMNVARQAALRAGLPVTVPGLTLDRQCSSGLMAIATAAKNIVVDGMTITAGGGVESISLVQNEHMNRYRAADPWLLEHQPDIYLPMHPETYFAGKVERIKAGETPHPLFDPDAYTKLISETEANFQKRVQEERAKAIRIQ